MAIQIFPTGRAREKTEPIKTVLTGLPAQNRAVDNKFISEPTYFGALNMDPFIGFIQRRCQQATYNMFKKLRTERNAVLKYNATRKHMYAYIDNNSDILCVAHADSVVNTRFFRRQGRFIRSPSLDDRLGCAVALDILPHLGIKTDILITDEEESGNSSARSFIASKNYKWVVEFDRAGEDVVTYDYVDDEWIKAIEGFFPDIGWGIYSDICDLDLGVCAMNIGIGYENYHSIHSYADLTELGRNLARFVKFYHRYKRTEFQHNPTLCTPKYHMGYGGWDDYEPWEALPVSPAPKDKRGEYFDGETLVYDEWYMDEVVLFSTWRERREEAFGEKWYNHEEPPEKVKIGLSSVPVIQETMFCSRCNGIFSESITQYEVYGTRIYCPHCGRTVNKEDAVRAYRDWESFVPGEHDDDS